MSLSSPRESHCCRSQLASASSIFAAVRHENTAGNRSRSVPHGSCRPIEGETRHSCPHPPLALLSGERGWGEGLRTTHYFVVFPYFAGRLDRNLSGTF